MEEPSVLDYVKSIIFFWRRETVNIPSVEPSPSEDKLKTQAGTAPSLRSELKPHSEEAASSTAGWFLFQPGTGLTLVRALIPLGLALLAQTTLEPPGRSASLAIYLYLGAWVILIWSNLRGEWRLSDPVQFNIDLTKPPFSFRLIGIWVCLCMSLLAFLMFGNNAFTTANLFVWLVAITGFLVAFWQPEPSISSLGTRVRGAWTQFRAGGITFSPWSLLVMAVFVLAVFYRLYLLDQVPAEMFSDHAEKLLDVGDVLNGQTRIFFPRNTGREAFQIYLTAVIALIFKTDLSFLSLKIGTALCGLFTLPFIYLLGVEVANRRVGLFAMFFAGIAYWPNVISRVALRFTLYPTFTAPVLYFLVRGLQRRNRNDFILAGFFLGVGLHGYSTYRFMPFVVIVAVAMYLLHRVSKATHLDTLRNLFILASTSFLIFLPLLRYAISNPMMFISRMMTRMGQAEQAYPAPPIQTFFINFWRAIIMPFWDNGEIWVHSIPNRPALGIVSAVFFGFGVLLLVIRYSRKRHWLDIFLLVSIPLLMMPSILSLAFPDENPSLNRTGGALVVIFIIVGMAVDSFFSLMKTRNLAPGGTWLAWLVGGGLLVGAAVQNYDLVFDQYASQFRTNAWNTSELGAVIRQFADSTGAEDSAWVVPYPHWVDTRLVGIRAGFPNRDYALWPERIPETVGDLRPKLFLVKPEDTDTLELLSNLYPTSVQRLFDSQIDGRDFYMVSVPSGE